MATLGTVPDEARADVFTELLAANFYWQETFGATLSWNADLEEVVLIYPLQLAGATPESVETIFNRFVELQSAWAGRFAEMVADTLWQVFETGVLSRLSEGCRKPSQEMWAKMLFVAILVLGLASVPRVAVGAMRMRRYHLVA